MYTTNMWMINQETTKELMMGVYEIDTSVIAEINWRGRLKKRIVEKIIKILEGWNVILPHFKSKSLVKCSSVEVSYDWVEKKIWENERIVRMLWDKDIDFIVMGADQLEGLKMVTDFKFPMGYESSFVRVHKGARERLTYMGVTVRLIPYWNGILCVS